jgi:hypothetical protein
MVAVAGSGGIADSYGGKYLDERKRVQVQTAKDPAEAVRLVMKEN